MRILYKEPLKDAVELDIEDDLKIMQELVGGYIETMRPVPNLDMAVVVNDMGKLDRLKPNVIIEDDVLVGNIFFVGIEIPEMRGLTDIELDIAKLICEKMDIRNF